MASGCWGDSLARQLRVVDELQVSLRNYEKNQVEQHWRTKNWGCSLASSNIQTHSNMHIVHIHIITICISTWNKMWFCHSYDCVLLNAHSLSILGQKWCKMIVWQLDGCWTGWWRQWPPRQRTAAYYLFFSHTQSLSFALYSLCVILGVSALICV